MDDSIMPLAVGILRIEEYGGLSYCRVFAAPVLGDRLERAGRAWGLIDFLGCCGSVEIASRRLR